MTATTLVVVLGIIAIVCVVGWFLLGKMQVPEPVRNIIVIVIVVVIAVVAILFLLRLLHGGGAGITIGMVDALRPYLA